MSAKILHLRPPQPGVRPQADVEADVKLHGVRAFLASLAAHLPCGEDPGDMVVLWRPPGEPGAMPPQIVTCHPPTTARAVANEIVADTAMLLDLDGKPTRN